MFTRLCAITLLCDFISCSSFFPHTTPVPHPLIDYVQFSGYLVIPWEFQDQYVSFGRKKKTVKNFNQFFWLEIGLMFPWLVLNSQEICMLCLLCPAWPCLQPGFQKQGVTKCLDLFGHSHHLQQVQFLINIRYLSVCSFLYHLQLVVIAYACSPVIGGGDHQFSLLLPSNLIPNPHWGVTGGRRNNVVIVQGFRWMQQIPFALYDYSNGLKCSKGA